DLAFAPWKTAEERIAGKAARKAAAARARAQPAPSPQPGQAVTVTAPPSGSPQQIAEAMLGSFGWSSSQFSCLDPLWEHESGWSVTADNPGSGAYGIPQALPGSRMASAGPDWQTNAATQITWGLEYIKGTYGSPCGAWAHEQATGWY
ncbi:MAG TPA: lytic transglycosylase domain-containing protein, partial [Streptosporangiaceae bacterium]|nr:lytic transglycosylase domain-containing protein [Streptosporangiaceae bacterium]